MSLPEIHANEDGRIAYRPAGNTDEWWIVQPAPIGQRPTIGWHTDLEGPGWWPMTWAPKPPPQPIPLRHRPISPGELEDQRRQLRQDYIHSEGEI